MALSTEVVYEGADNVIGLQLAVDGTVLADHTVITRAVIELGKGTTLLAPDPYMTIDSDTYPSYFDFTDTSKLILQLGAAGISKGRHIGALTIYLPAYAGGLSFGEVLDLRVK